MLGATMQPAVANAPFNSQASAKYYSNKSRYKVDLRCTVYTNYLEMIRVYSGEPVINLFRFLWVWNMQKGIIMQNCLPLSLTVRCAQYITMALYQVLNSTIKISSISMSSPIVTVEPRSIEISKIDRQTYRNYHFVSRLQRHVEVYVWH